MRSVRFSKQFSLLLQEAHLAKNSILSGFDLLLKAEFGADRDGYFYSAFFHLSIGIERILKLAVVVDYMIKNDLKAPTKSQLKSYGHDIAALYTACNELRKVYRPSAKQKHAVGVDEQIVEFLSRFAKSTRYFNLDEIASSDASSASKSPFYEWWSICAALYDEFIPWNVREKQSLQLMYSMDQQGIPAGYSWELDANGHPMTVFDQLNRRRISKKASHLAVWRMVELLRPIHFLLDDMGQLAHEKETEKAVSLPLVPHFEDFFWFLLANRTDIMKRKSSWLRLFNS
ncbi:hypothetical protein [Stenotrophomonas sp.]|uniref:hypothetical protein n=1 Tax=Stenotrophomonas sp. TaxID=69392 RepID=UPI0028A130D4|nr:hypothetical protein [Stenotrophomonas sp.]